MSTKPRHIGTQPPMPKVIYTTDNYGMADSESERFQHELYNVRSQPLGITAQVMVCYRDLMSPTTDDAEAERVLKETRAEIARRKKEAK